MPWVHVLSGADFVSTKLCGPSCYIVFLLSFCRLFGVNSCHNLVLVLRATKKEKKSFRTSWKQPSSDGYIYKVRLLNTNQTPTSRPCLLITVIKVQHSTNTLFFPLSGSHQTSQKKKKKEKRKKKKKQKKKQKDIEKVTITNSMFESRH